MRPRRTQAYLVWKHWCSPSRRFFEKRLVVEKNNHLTGASKESEGQIIFEKFQYSNLSFFRKIHVSSQCSSEVSIREERRIYRVFA